MMSVESPDAHKDAIDRMKGSILGLVLTLSAFIILRTINLSLVTPSLTPLPGVAGVFYYNSNEKKPVGLEESNVTNRPAGFDNLIYDCTGNGSGGTGPTLLIWEFPKPNFQGNDNNYGGVNVVRKTCGQTEPIASLGSFRMAFETPGVYYCLGECSGDMCLGYMSSANVAGGQLSAPFKDKTKSIMIVNDIASNIRYGAIFHDDDDPTRGGFCSPVILYRDINKQRACLDDIPVSSSADIFVWNAKTPETSGDGIEFYSEPFGWNSGAKAGKYFLCQKANGRNTCNGAIGGNYWYDDSQNLVFNYTNVDRPQEYTQLYTNFQQRPGSIRIKGDYLVVLFSLVGENQYCQTFFYKDVPNLNRMEFITAKNQIDTIDVIPIK